MDIPDAARRTPMYVCIICHVHMRAERACMPCMISMYMHEANNYIFCSHVNG